MTIAVLDPALFLTSQPTGPIPDAEEKALARIIDDVVRTCRAQRAVIPAPDWYWKDLQRELMGPLYPRLRDPRLKVGLDELRRYARPMSLPGRPERGKTKMWHVRPLFDWRRLSAKWLGVMEDMLLGCAQRDENTVLVTRLFEGRNMRLHAVQKCTLTEKTRWRIYVHVPGRPPRHIPCVRNPRNLTAPWTARLDEKLPDSGRFPFCPPKHWWRQRTEVCRTFESKPAWIDGFGNGWIQPATGGDNHWDVFLDDVHLREAVGLNQINVVAWGTAEKGKVPGELHHVPKEKASHVDKDAAWTCPPGR